MPDASIRFSAGIRLAALALSVQAWGAVSVELVDGDRCQVRLDGQVVVLPSAPALMAGGGGQRQYFDPSTREVRTVKLDGAGRQIEIYTKQRQRVLLGAARRRVTATANGVEFREDYPDSGTWWTARIEAVDGNAVDLSLQVETDPGLWLAKFDFDMLSLPLSAQAKGDSGQISSFGRTRGHDDKYRSDAPWLGPISGEVRINYPCGPQSFVPAVVLQDDRLAMGVCLLGAHRVWRPTYGELLLKPAADGSGYRVSVGTGWGYTTSFENFYHHRFDKRYRFRFSAPRPVGAGGYLRLVDAKDLWKDYVDELDREVPVAPVPVFDRSKNNIIIQNHFLSEHWCKTPENPQGWVLNHPDWKGNKWEWTVPAGASDEEVQRRTGFHPGETGRPVKWVKSFAKKCVEEMRDTNAQAMIIWRTSISDPRNRDGLGGMGGINTDYLAESHFFQPDLEERQPVDGPVRPWDWAVADIRVLDGAGRVIAARSGVEIHAADRQALISFSRYENLAQTIDLARQDIAPDGEAWAKSAGLAYEDRYRFGTALRLAVSDRAVARKLAGRRAGDTVRIEVSPQVGDPALRTGVVIEAAITGVSRAVIDVWAKAMEDAGQEFGFLVREDITVGPPWRQSWVGMDFAAEWQYTMLKQRIQWHRERFGARCRWFYFDVFATYTPQFVLAMLRADFPDCFFFAEHPNDTAIRHIQAWNWYGGFGELEKYLNPDAIATVLPDRLGTGKDDQDREIFRPFWRNPNYFLCTHRDARRLVRLLDGGK